MVSLTIYMFYVIHLCILHYAFPESILYWKFCYIYFLFRSDSPTAPGLYLCLYGYVCASYNSVFVDMFLHVIQYNYSLYFIMGILSYISPMYGLLHHCAVVISTFLLIYLWISYIFLLKYVCVLHKICSYVVLHIGNHVMNIYCI